MAIFLITLSIINLLILRHSIPLLRYWNGAWFTAGASLLVDFCWRTEFTYNSHLNRLAAYCQRQLFTFHLFTVKRKSQYATNHETKTHESQRIEKISQQLQRSELLPSTLTYPLFLGGVWGEAFMLPEVGICWGKTTKGL